MVSIESPTNCMIIIPKQLKALMTPLSKTTEQAWSIKEFLQLKESHTDP